MQLPVDWGEPDVHSVQNLRDGDHVIELLHESKVDSAEGLGQPPECKGPFSDFARAELAC